MSFKINISTQAVILLQAIEKHFCTACPNSCGASGENAPLAKDCIDTKASKILANAQVLLSKKEIVTDAD